MMRLPVEYKSLSLQDRAVVRQRYIIQQRGLCYWCGAPLTDPPAARERRKLIKRYLFPREFFNFPIHLQHCRKTGMTEGAVHAHCNAVMWQYYGR